MRSPFRVESGSVLVRNEGSSYTFLVFSPEPSRWGHPYGSSLSQASIGSKTLAPSLVFWCRAFAMGSPLSGRVAYFYALDRNEGLFNPQLLRDGVTLRLECGLSSHSIETKFSLDSSSVFLQDGVTLFRSGSRNLISSEGIPSVGLMGAFFPGRPRDESRHPSVYRYALNSGSVPHSGVFASCVDSVCTPLATKGVGLWPSASTGPVASRPPLVDRSASAASRWFFSPGRSCAGLTRMVAR